MFNFFRADSTIASKYISDFFLTVLPLYSRQLPTILIDYYRIFNLGALISAETTDSWLEKIAREFSLMQSYTQVYDSRNPLYYIRINNLNAIYVEAQTAQRNLETDRTGVKYDRYQLTFVVPFWYRFQPLIGDLIRLKFIDPSLQKDAPELVLDRLYVVKQIEQLIPTEDNQIQFYRLTVEIFDRSSVLELLNKIVCDIEYEAVTWRYYPARTANTVDDLIARLYQSGFTRIAKAIEIEYSELLAKLDESLASIHQKPYLIYVVDALRYPLFLWYRFDQIDLDQYSRVTSLQIIDTSKLANPNIFSAELASTYSISSLTIAVEQLVSDLRTNQLTIPPTTVTSDYADKFGSTLELLASDTTIRTVFESIIGFEFNLIEWRYQLVKLVNRILKQLLSSSALSVDWITTNFDTSRSLYDNLSNWFDALLNSIQPSAYESLGFHNVQLKQIFEFNLNEIVDSDGNRILSIGSQTRTVLHDTITTAIVIKLAQTLTQQTLSFLTVHSEQLKPLLSQFESDCSIGLLVYGVWLDKLISILRASKPTDPTITFPANPSITEWFGISVTLQQILDDSIWSQLSLDDKISIVSAVIAYTIVGLSIIRLLGVSRLYDSRASTINTDLRPSTSDNLLKLILNQQLSDTAYSAIVSLLDDDSSTTTSEAERFTMCNPIRILRAYIETVGYESILLALTALTETIINKTLSIRFDPADTESKSNYLKQLLADLIVLFDRINELEIASNTDNPAITADYATLTADSTNLTNWYSVYGLVDWLDRLANLDDSANDIAIERLLEAIIEYLQLTEYVIPECSVNCELLTFESDNSYLLEQLNTTRFYLNLDILLHSLDYLLTPISVVIDWIDIDTVLAKLSADTTLPFETILANLNFCSSNNQIVSSTYNRIISALSTLSAQLSYEIPLFTLNPIVHNFTLLETLDTSLLTIDRPLQQLEAQLRRLLQRLDTTTQFGELFLLTDSINDYLQIELNRIDWLFRLSELESFRNCGITSLPVITRYRSTTSDTIEQINSLSDSATDTDSTDDAASISDSTANTDTAESADTTIWL